MLPHQWRPRARQHARSRIYAPAFWLRPSLRTRASGPRMPRSAGCSSRAPAAPRFANVLHGPRALVNCPPSGTVCRNSGYPILGEFTEAPVGAHPPFHFIPLLATHEFGVALAALRVAQLNILAA